MVQSLLRRALGAVKDQASIGLARVSSAKSRQLPALEIAIVKATSHDELVMVDEVSISEIVQILSFSRGYSSVCVSLLSKRLSRTKNWVVALKVLLVIHRLLLQDSSVVDSSFDDELMLASRRMLALSGFCDGSKDPLAQLCSSFVRNYALYIDEFLDCFVLGAATLQKISPPATTASGELVVDYNDYRMDYSSYKQDPDPNPYHARSSSSENDEKVGMLLRRIPVLQHLLEHVLGCSAGVEVHHPLIRSALALIVRDSFRVYSDVCDGMSTLLNEFFLMIHKDGLKAVALYSRLAKQAEKLGELYARCREMGVCVSEEFPSVQKVSQEHLVLLDDYLKDNTRKSVVGSGERPDKTELNHEASSSNQSWETFGTSSSEELNNTNVVNQSQASIEELREDKKSMAGTGDIDAVSPEVENSKLKEEEDVDLKKNLEESAKPSDWEIALMDEAKKLSYSSTKGSRRKSTSFSLRENSSGFNSSTRSVVAQGKLSPGQQGMNSDSPSTKKKVVRSRLPLLSMSAIPHGGFEFGGDEVMFGASRLKKDGGRIGIGSPGSYAKLMNKPPQGYKHLRVPR